MRCAVHVTTEALITFTALREENEVSGGVNTSRTAKGSDGYYLDKSSSILRKNVDISSSSPQGCKLGEADVQAPDFAVFEATLTVLACEDV